jgi:hypothetical protein
MTMPLQFSVQGHTPSEVLDLLRHHREFREADDATRSLTAKIEALESEQRERERFVDDHDPVRLRERIESAKSAYEWTRKKHRDAQPDAAQKDPGGTWEPLGPKSTKLVWRPWARSSEKPANKFDDQLSRAQEHLLAVEQLLAASRQDHHNSAQVHQAKSRLAEIETELPALREQLTSAEVARDALRPAAAEHVRPEAEKQLAALQEKYSEACDALRAKREEAERKLAPLHAAVDAAGEDLQYQRFLLSQLEQ